MEMNESLDGRYIDRLADRQPKDRYTQTKGKTDGQTERKNTIFFLKPFAGKKKKKRSRSKIRDSPIHIK